MGFLGTISAVMVALKLLGETQASWFLVMCPFILEFAILVRKKYIEIKEQKELMRQLQDLYKDKGDNNE